MGKNKEGFQMKKNFGTTIAGAVLLIAGLVLVFVTRGKAIAEAAGAGDKMFFALSLIVTLMGLVTLIAGLTPGREKTDVRQLAIAGLFAALCYIGFTFCKIDIPVGTEKTAFHLGNVFCVLAALLLGGFWGGMAGAVGMTIADLTTAYVTSAPKTFLLKLCIGLITGFFAHKVFHIREEGERKVSLPVAVFLSCAAGMLFNVIADPVVGYFYKTYVLGVPQKAAAIWMKIGAVTTAVNAVVAVVVAGALYLALRPALKHARLMP